MRTVLAALVLAGLVATPAFSQFLSPTQDRDRPGFRPAPNSDEAFIRVPLPRARPKMFAAIPLPRPAPAGATSAAILVAPDPTLMAPEPAPVAPKKASAKATSGGPNILPPLPAEPVTASPKSGDVFMPIPLVPTSSSRSESPAPTTDEERLSVPAK
jgi:hypothetical protein